jgi:hypothetical protein
MSVLILTAQQFDSLRSYSSGQNSRYQTSRLGKRHHKTTMHA